MSASAPSPALIDRALTHRAAASLLTKSPIWSLLVAFMAQKLATLETDILNNANLDATALQKRRDERLFLRQTLTDFANNFRSAFTSPPASEDTGLQKMPIPPEVEAALALLISPQHPASSIQQRAASPQPPADPRNINPFDAKPLPPP